MEQSHNMNPVDQINLGDTAAQKIPQIVELAEMHKADARYHHIEWDKANMAGNNFAAAEHLELAEEALDGILHPEQATSKSLLKTAVGGLKRLFTRTN